MTDYSSQEVSAITGLTLRQLQWWDEQGFIVPQRDGPRGNAHGRSRRYTAEQVETLMIAAKLRASRLSLRAIRRVLPVAQKHATAPLIVVHGRHVAVIDRQAA